MVDLQEPILLKRNLLGGQNAGCAPGSVWTLQARGITPAPNGCSGHIYSYTQIQFLQAGSDIGIRTNSNMALLKRLSHQMRHTIKAWMCCGQYAVQSYLSLQEIILK
jgi:hypothetical protein